MFLTRKSKASLISWLVNSGCPSSENNHATIQCTVQGTPLPPPPAFSLPSGGGQCHIVMIYKNCNLEIGNCYPHAATFRLLRLKETHHTVGYTIPEGYLSVSALSFFTQPTPGSVTCPVSLFNVRLLFITDYILSRLLIRKYFFFPL